MSAFTFQIVTGEKKTKVITYNSASSWIWNM